MNETNFKVFMYKDYFSKKREPFKIVKAVNLYDDCESNANFRVEAAVKDVNSCLRMDDVLTGYEYTNYEISVFIDTKLYIIIFEDVYATYDTTTDDRTPSNDEMSVLFGVADDIRNLIKEDFNTFENEESSFWDAYKEKFQEIINKRGLQPQNVYRVNWK